MKTAKAMKAVKAMNNLLSSEFRFKGIDLRLSLADSGVWRVQSKSGSSFDDMGAAQTLAKDLGEEYEKETLPFSVRTFSYPLFKSASRIFPSSGAPHASCSCFDAAVSSSIRQSAVRFPSV